MLSYHKTVLLNEAIAHLKVVPGGKYIDCTLGDAGHTLEILKQGGKVLALDLDPVAIKRAEQRLKSLSLSANYHLIEGNFRDVFEIATSCGFNDTRGILYDVGTSFAQLETPKRGFSFESDAPLDMRMSPKFGVSAKDLVNALPEKELARLIFEYGEDRFAKGIARAVVKARKEKEIVTCRDLTEIVESTVPTIKGSKIHKATRTFQALRIAVNDELTNLKVSLTGAERLLIPGGRLVVITFHSLEDKITKSLRSRMKEIPDLVVPSSLELSENRRSRSAKMRVFEKP